MKIIGSINVIQSADLSSDMTSVTDFTRSLLVKVLWPSCFCLIFRVLWLSDSWIVFSESSLLTTTYGVSVITSDLDRVRVWAVNNQLFLNDEKLKVEDFYDSVLKYSLVLLTLNLIQIQTSCSINFFYSILFLLILLTFLHCRKFFGWVHPPLMFVIVHMHRQQ